MALQSPGVRVTVTDESQYASNEALDTVPLIVLATSENKNNASNSGVASGTTSSNAETLQLLTSTRDLGQKFGVPTFRELNGTVVQGDELNEYGLLVAHKVLNLANRCWVIRGDVNLDELAPQATEPEGPPEANTHWLDTNDTDFGIFEFKNGSFQKVTPKVITDSVNLNGSAPSAGIGKNGEYAVVAVNNQATSGEIKVYHKLNDAWYLVGSTNWDQQTPTVLNGSTRYSDSSDHTDTKNVDTGDNFDINGNAVGQLSTTIQGSSVVPDPLINLYNKTLNINGNTVTFSTENGATIDGTEVFNNASTEVSGLDSGDQFSIDTPTAVSATTLTVFVEYTADTGVTAGGQILPDDQQTITINGVTISLDNNTGSPQLIGDIVTDINNASGHGITASSTTVGGNDALVLNKDNTTGGANIDVQSGSGTTVSDLGLEVTTYRPTVQNVVDLVNNASITNVSSSANTVSNGVVFRISNSTERTTVQEVTNNPLGDFGIVPGTYGDVARSQAVTDITGTAGVTASINVNILELTKSDKSSSENIVLSNGTADWSTFGFSEDEYSPTLDEVVSQVNGANISNITASVENDSAGDYIRITDNSGQSMTLSSTAGDPLSDLGLASSIKATDLYFADHNRPPTGAVEGDVWIKTTSPNRGADYMVRFYNEQTNQFERILAPVYQGNTEAFNEYGISLEEGDLYVQYDIDANTTAAHKIKRYNGSNQLTVSVTTQPQTNGSLDIGNNDDPVQTITVSTSDSFSDIANKINALNISNVEAQLTSNGFDIVNTEGRDVVLRDNTAAWNNVFGVQSGLYSNWIPLRNVDFGNVVGYVAQPNQPSSTPSDGTLWYDNELANDKVDLLVQNGSTWSTFNGDLQLRATKPNSRSGGGSLQIDDLWINTSNLDAYPDLRRWNGTKWVKVDKTDETTGQGIIFQDARVDSSSQLDPDAPNPLAYPSGLLLWNTRASSWNVKVWRPNYFLEGGFSDDVDYTSETYDVGNQTLQPLSDAGRWVNYSGNQLDGSPYMGNMAQRQVIIEAMQGALQRNENLRAYRTNFFNLVLAPGYPELSDDLLGLSNDRKQTSFVIADTPKDLRSDSTTIQNWATNEANAPRTGSDGLTLADEKVAMYYPSMGLTTNVDGREVAVPSSLGAIYAYLYNDRVAYPWFAPAGIDRGQLSGVFTSVGYIDTNEQEFRPVDLSQGLTDTLYINNLNPIVFTPGRGLYINGQKTLNPQSTALDRVNVVRLITYLRYQFELLAEPFLFEINDQQTRESAQDAFDRFLGDLVGLRALYDYLVVADETNNTPSRIDQNELWVDVAIQPAKAIEFINIPVRVKNTGENLSN